ncbi:MAG TPA: hypothetical protein VM054_03445 [bacterium]|nr:hypothetical protein [bacterium]
MTGKSFLKGPEWRVERIALVAMAGLAAAIIVLFALAPTVEEGRAERLDLFLAALPDDARAAFEGGRYDEAAALISEAYRTDLVFHERWEELKDTELVNIFTVGEVLDYYVRYFVPAARSEAR